MSTSFNQQLQECAKQGDLIGVQQAIAMGADIQAEDNSALCYAVIYGHLNVITYLVQHGADIHVENDYALRWSARNGHFDVVTYLALQGADISVGIAVAEEYNQTHIIEWLERYQLAQYEKEILLTQAVAHTHTSSHTHRL